MSAIQPLPTAANTFAVKETSFSLSSVNKNASDGELRHVRSSSKPRERNSLLERHLASFPKLYSAYGESTLQTQKKKNTQREEVGKTL
jgi:hypothetical protein